MTSPKDTALYIIKGILPDTTVIDIEESILEDGTIRLVVLAPPEISGQIIGKQGKIIKAIRTILAIAHPQSKFSLDITN